MKCRKTSEKELAYCGILSLSENSDDSCKFNVLNIMKMIKIMYNVKNKI